MTYTDNELDNIISLTGKAKANALKEILDREVDRLKREAQGSADEGEARNQISSKRKAYKIKLQDALKTRRQTTGKSTGQLNILAKIIDMNIFHNGNLISAANLVQNDLTGKLEIRNLKSNIFDGGVFSKELGASGNLGRNLNRIKDIIDEDRKEVKEVEIKSNFPFDKFLGSIDASKGENRKDIYDYWESIAEFPMAKGEVLEARHRFFNIVAGLISAERLFDAQTIRGKGFEDDTTGAGDITGQLMAEMAQGIEDAIDQNIGYDSKDPQNNTTPKGWNDEMDDPRMLQDDGVDWLNDVSILQADADPLLMYENNKGDKLLAITEEGETDLVNLLSDPLLLL